MTFQPSDTREFATNDTGLHKFARIERLFLTFQPSDTREFATNDTGLHKFARIERLF